MQEEHRGKWSLKDTALQLKFEGILEPQIISCRFIDQDTLVLSYTTGEVLEAHR